MPTNVKLIFALLVIVLVAGMLVVAAGSGFEATLVADIPGITGEPCSGTGCLIGAG